MREDHITWRIAFAAVVLLAVGLLSPAATAQTADGLTPAVEEVCDGLEGRLFGLCNAYCEAIDCDTRELELGVVLPECDALRANLVKLTDETVFPCDSVCPEPPQSCSGNGVPGQDAQGCEICVCDPGWGGLNCATCEAGFDDCDVCGGDGSTCSQS